MKKLFLPVLLLVSICGFTQKQKIVLDPLEKYAQTINPTGLKEKLTVIASADMQGRETTSAGQRKAATYIEGQFEKFGLEPATTGGYQMQFPIFQDTIVDLWMKVNGYDEKLGSDYTFNVTTAASGSLEIKEVVFASYGIVSETRNDFSEIEVKDKWVMLLEGSPTEPGEPEDKTSSYSLSAKFEKIKSLGAKGLIWVSEDFPKKPTDPGKGKMNLKKASTIPINLITVSMALGHVLLNMDPNNLLQNLKIIPTGAYSAKIQLTISKRTLMLQSSNVLAILPGTDKKDEYVFITAHYDHLGVRNKEIFYGADDNGSGTAAVLQLAEAFARAKNEGFAPRRNIVFMTVSGEEKGLLGSAFYSQHPTFPLNKTSVDLNIDMIGRTDPKYKGDSLNYLYVIGDDKLSSDLKVIIDSINKKYSNLQLDRKYNDLKDLNKFYYRSDHYNFAKNGVPAIFYFNGTHLDYHKSSDTIDKINFDLMAKRVKFIFYTAWDMANRNNMLKRDIPMQALLNE